MEEAGSGAERTPRGTGSIETARGKGAVSSAERGTEAAMDESAKEENLRNKKLSEAAKRRRVRERKGETQTQAQTQVQAQVPPAVPETSFSSSSKKEASSHWDMQMTWLS